MRFSAIVTLFWAAQSARPEHFAQLRHQLDTSSMVESESWSPLFDVPASKIAASLSQGLTALAEGFAEFARVGLQAEATEESGDDVPGYVRAGLENISAGLWEMDKLLVPTRYHGSSALKAVEDEWTNAFMNMPPITQHINRFRQYGDTAALIKALVDIISKASEAAPAPKLPAYLEALNQVVFGMGKAFQDHGSGQLDMGLQAVWQGFDKALRAVDDGDIDLSDAVGKMDITMSQLVTRVLAEKRRIVSSKVCTKRDRLPAKQAPHVCEPGWVSDDNSHCIPAPTPEVDCKAHCAGQAGMCSSYCSEGKACCKAGGEDAEACQGTSGFQPEFDTYQCVQPGPRVAFFVKEAGEAMLRGYWVATSKEVNGKPSYSHESHIPGKSPKMAWSSKQEEWQMYTEDPDSGLKTVLYQSGMDSPKFPIHSWTVIAGISPPVIEQRHDGVFEMDEPELRQPAHKKVAQCLEGWNQEILMCVSPCATGWTRRVGTCQQTCGGEFPADGEEGICGTAQDEMQFATLAMEGMSANSRRHPKETVTTELEEAGVNVSALTATFDSFFDHSEKFAIPLCPDREAEALAASQPLVKG